MHVLESVFLLAKVDGDVTWLLPSSFVVWHVVCGMTAAYRAKYLGARCSTQPRIRLRRHGHLVGRWAHDLQVRLKG